MAYIFIATQPEYAALAEYIEQTLAKAGIAVWIKDSSIDWEIATYAMALHSVTKFANAFLFLDSGTELDPPEYLNDIITAKQSDKPIFFIKSAKEFHLLLPQLRSIIPKGSEYVPLPVIRLVAEVPKKPPPPIHLHPGWLEAALGGVLLVLLIVILLSL